MSFALRKVPGGIRLENVLEIPNIVMIIHPKPRCVLPAVIREILTDAPMRPPERFVSDRVRITFM
jgi:hypothetical protein